MPAKKKTSPENKRAVKEKKSNIRRNDSAENEEKLNDARNNEKKSRPVSTSMALVPYIIALGAVLIAAFMIFRNEMGIIGNGVAGLLFGLLSWSSALIPIMMVIVALYFRNDYENGKNTDRIIMAILCIVCVSVLSYAFYCHSESAVATADFYAFDIKKWWADGVEMKSGGVIGGIFGWVFHKCISFAGTLILTIPLLLLFALKLFGVTPHYLVLTVRYRIKQARDNAQQEKERLDAIYREREYSEQNNSEYNTPLNDQLCDNGKKQNKENEPKYNPDVSLEEEAEIPKAEEPCPIDKNIYNRIVTENNDCVTYDENIEPFDKSDEDTVVIGGTVLKRTTGIPAEAKANDTPDDATGDVEDFDKLVEKLTNSACNSREAEPKLKVQKTPLTTDEKAPVPEKTLVHKEYKFPPITLLNGNVNQTNTDFRRELAETSSKLVKTLESFKVRTRIVNISRGPTITRYELAPEEGVRVRAIVNLVDDISLSLASTGVRIEAPIPGKQAVGIEVPNKNPNTVYLRDLIDNPKFKQAESKVQCALGQDVAGEPIYLNVAKMPHLLIAGATGMGKSVCINSLLISILYKASPDDVKLMLIDPKKVEFSLYNDLPHLLIPPVSEAKRAAGALQWAVAEMERRYGLIEDVGVRNIESYNQATENDPDREHLPLIVVVIDELADLMMSSPDVVEDAICRLAQKARAAGIHLVIGTQRPSVDVVTGLIKANIPSRIAMTVASITDSRVILDYGGAEKLIGKGDMLFAPVGSPKPTRVQGAFVTDGEIEKIVSYIRDNYGSLEYDENIVDEIVELSKNCDSGKKSGSVDANIEGSDSEDPMLKSAIELAVDSGKISTSLLQRKLSIGYGRAAKLIDEMEERGIVSAPDGQKPRSVLITKEEYMEMVLRQSN